MITSIFKKISLVGVQPVSLRPAIRGVIATIGLFMTVSVSAIQQDLIQPLVADPEVLATRTIFGDFQNLSYTAAPVQKSVIATATAFFSGSVCSAACPGNGVAFLQQSAFGQPVARNVPYPAFVQDTVNTARNSLYNTSTGALRYTSLIYGDDPSTQAVDVVNLLSSRLSGTVITNLYGAPERNVLVQVERSLRNALKYAPGDKALRAALLDLYYDRAVAEVTAAKEKLVDAIKVRILPAVDSEFGDAALAELATYAEVIAGYKFALSGYFELLNDTLGVNMAEIDSGAAAFPFGYYIFQQDVPLRALRSATYRNAAGQVIDVYTNTAVPPTVLFSGYKDLVMLFDLLGDLAEAVREQTRLYAIRGAFLNPAEKPIILGLIKQAHEKLYLEGNILLGIFPQDNLPEKGHTSGLQEAIERWSRALTSLAAARGWIEGDTNVLGFDPEFLMLSQNSGAKFDSYDALADWLNKEPNGPLTVARANLADAKKSDENFRTTADQLALQYQNRRVTYDDRLASLVGAHRCNAQGSDCSGQCPDTNGGCYSKPAANTGSEVNLQVQSISIANNRVEQALTRMENLYKQIEIEIDRRGKAAGIESAISQVVLDYGSKQAKLTEAIAAARARAARAARNAGVVGGFVQGIVGIGTGNVAGAIGGFMSAGTSAYVGNANIRMEKQVGRLSAEKERLAAEERATLNDLNGQILNVESAALIKTWWLQAATLALEIEESELIVAQDMARLKALIDEIQSLEQRMDQENAFLAKRYFADPIHRLRMQNDMIDADLAFQEAQKWLFFAMRALEYKWNLPFDFVDGSQRFWNEYSLYETRNATDLDKLFIAMSNYDMSRDLSGLRDDYFDWFSFREDFFGYRELVNGVPQEYPDPQTGVMVDAKTAFRSKLKSLMDSDGNILIDFSTVREVPGGSFFLGPRYSSTGTLLSKGLYLDKINWLKLAIPGFHNTLGSRVPAELKYGGVSFLRDQDVGFSFTGQPDSVIGEMTPYPTRYWYFDGKTSSWKFNEGLSTPVLMEKTANPRVEPSTLQINIFKERAVAASGWNLTIFTQDTSGLQLLNVDEVDDIEMEFFHYAYTRP